MSTPFLGPDPFLELGVVLGPGLPPQYCLICEDLGLPAPGCPGCGMQPRPCRDCGDSLNIDPGEVLCVACIARREALCELHEAADTESAFSRAIEVAVRDHFPEMALDLSGLSVASLSGALVGAATTSVAARAGWAKPQDDPFRAILPR